MEGRCWLHGGASCLFVVSAHVYTTTCYVTCHVDCHVTCVFEPRLRTPVDFVLAFFCRAVYRAESCTSVVLYAIKRVCLPGCLPV